jgi:hypothetical protein
VLARDLGTLVLQSKTSNTKAQAVGAPGPAPVRAAEGVGPLGVPVNIVNDALAWTKHQLDTSGLKVSLTSPGRWSPALVLWVKVWVRKLPHRVAKLKPTKRTALVSPGPTATLASTQLIVHCAGADCLSPPWLLLVLFVLLFFALTIKAEQLFCILTAYLLPVQATKLVPPSRRLILFPAKLSAIRRCDRILGNLCATANTFLT